MGLSTQGPGAGLVRLPRRKEKKEPKGRNSLLGREPAYRQPLLTLGTLTLSVCTPHPSRQFFENILGSVFVCGFRLLC